MINIRVVSFNGQPPTQTLDCEFDELGGTMGRAETNQFVLPDPDRHVSRVQARVQWNDGHFELINVGANALDFGGRSIANGSATRIEPGDRITIGGYVLEVSAVAADGIAVAESTNVGMPRASEPVDDPLGLFGGPPQGVGGGDPFAGFANPFSSLPHTGGAEDRLVQTEPATDEAPRASDSTIPQDFDPFADPLAPPCSRSRAEQGLLDDLGFGQGAESVSGSGINTMFGLGPVAPGATDKVDPFAGSALGEPQYGVVSRAILDPVAALSGAPVPSGPEAPIADQVPEIHGAYTPPVQAVGRDAVPSRGESATTVAGGNEAANPETGSGMPSPCVEVGPPLAQPSSAPAAGDLVSQVASPVQPVPTVVPDDLQSPNVDALMRAFLDGLGVPDLPLSQSMTPEFLERVGRLLREATQGTLDLLLARAVTKREVRAEVTMIVSHDNNPLKFSPNAEVALAHLLAPRGKGFLTPVEAMRDAYDDLRAHELGFMAGMRAALAGVLQRFDPAVLERRLTEKSLLDTLLSMNRRARLWDLYMELYRDIACEAEDDFHVLFGREFLRAYEEQVRRHGRRDSST